MSRRNPRLVFTFRSITGKPAMLEKIRDQSFYIRIFNHIKFANWWFPVLWNTDQRSPVNNHRLFTVDPPSKLTTVFHEICLRWDSNPQSPKYCVKLLRHRNIHGVDYSDYGQSNPEWLDLHLFSCSLRFL